MRRGITQQLVVGLRLYYRNTMALIYGYAFPLIFLIAFWVLYRYDQVPLVRHMGELLTIAVLGGACFGLPTSMVAERERGVWRRYRLTPMPTAALVVSTVLARYVILLTAGLLQVTAAMLLGMPAPAHPFDLLVVFTFVSFAFLGLGLVIAMLADNVPAVQALGQCIFLPMLIIGGVAVQLSALPDWALHLSAYFPGRYAVEAIQATVNGDGLSTTGFSLFALTLIGLAGCLAGARMFRWDCGQRFLTSGGKGWLAVALAAWVVVGIAAETSDRIAPRAATRGTVASTEVPRASTPAPVPPTSEPAPAPATPPSSAPPAVAGTPSGQPSPVAPPEASVTTTSAPPSTTSAPAAAPAAPATTTARPAAEEPPASSETTTTAGTTAPGSAEQADTAQQAGAAQSFGPARWQDVTIDLIEQDIVFNRLPPDSGVVTPIAAVTVEPDQSLWDELDTIAARLETWKPGHVEDPVQRVRNLLYVAAVPDIYQVPIEPFVPAIVYARIQQEIPKDDLIKILYWIGIHPEQGDDSAVGALEELGLGEGPGDMVETRGRAAVYGVKLLGHLLGKRPFK